MSIKNFGLKVNHAGRPKGAKNRLSWSFLNALADDFEQHGIETIRICRVEEPISYMKVIAGLMPKEFEFSDNRLAELGDDELDAVITYARSRLTAKRELAGDLGSRENETLN
jgi:hypothetical protein